MQVEFEAKAFMSKYVSIDEIANGKSMPLVAQFGNRLAGDGYTHIGTARVIITIDPQDKIVSNQIAALRQQLQTVRAEHQREQNALIDQISKLEALTFDGAAA